MLKWICAVAFASAFAAPAFAQKTDIPDRPLKQTKAFDQAALKEGITALKASGECSVTYIVGADGKPKDIKPGCTPPEMDPYVVRMINSGEWQSEITGGEFFDSYPQKQVFKFGSSTAVDPRGEKAPVVINDLVMSDLNRAINQVGKNGSCNVKFTVGADGKPKDIVPGCTPPAFDARISDAIKKMKYQPGLKGGQPVDWPNMTMPLNLTQN